MNKRKHWSKTENGIRGFLESKESHSEALKKERLRLKEIRDFEKGEVVNINHRKRDYDGVVVRVNDKTYGIAFDGDSYVTVGKESLSGYTDYIKSQITGDGRRFVGESCKLSKKENHGEN